MRRTGSSLSSLKCLFFRLLGCFLLRKIIDKLGYAFLYRDQLTNEEQIRLAARTTIMMGVHGNGLTHLLWMKPEQRSTVMEFFYPGGFACELLTSFCHVGMKTNWIFFFNQKLTMNSPLVVWGSSTTASGVPSTSPFFLFLSGHS